MRHALASTDERDLHLEHGGRKSGTDILVVERIRESCGKKSESETAMTMLVRAKMIFWRKERLKTPANKLLTLKIWKREEL